ncbi:MAG: hypothetical protein K2X38_10880 [Gemmataceae bacterium]|nr:hypothetical protein [Gemmataceae bacterium]
MRSTRACQLRIEVVGLIKGFSSLLHDHVPHVHLNPLFLPIPKLDPMRRGTILGASRDLAPAARLMRRHLPGGICRGHWSGREGEAPFSQPMPFTSMRSSLTRVRLASCM